MTMYLNHFDSLPSSSYAVQEWMRSERIQFCEPIHQIHARAKKHRQERLERFNLFGLFSGKIFQRS